MNLLSFGLSLSLPAADGSLCAVYRGVCRSGEAEESNPGGAFPGSCCGAHPAGPGDVYSVSGGHGRIPPGQQDPAAHGENEGGHVVCLLHYSFPSFAQRELSTELQNTQFHIYASEGTN